MSRIRPPNRRDSRTVSIRYADMSGLSFKGHATYSKNPDGSIYEIFITTGKPGTAGEAALRDAGLLLSLLLQSGTSIEEIQSALTRNDDGSPAGPVSIVVDTIVREDQDENA